MSEYEVVDEELQDDEAAEPFTSGFVALVGRPSVGKSTLLNACLGEKVAITSPVAQTTRRRLRAVVNTEPSKGYWGMQFDIVEHKDYEIGGNDIVRIYGHDGMFVDIYTDNPVIQKDNAVSRGLDKFHRQY